MEKNIFGNYLRNLREKHGMKQSTLAEQLDLSHSFINFIETGKRLPGKNTLKKLSVFFNIDLNHLVDLLQKQKKCNNQSTDKTETASTSNQIKKLTTILEKLDKPLLDDLMSDFIKQVHELLVKTTANYSLSNLRDKFNKELGFNNHQENSYIEGFLKLPENNQLFFKFRRWNHVLTLELLQHDQSKIELFEKWIGPYVYKHGCKVSIPQVLESQRGISFTWFSPNCTLEDQRTYLLEQKNIEMKAIMFNDARLAWYVQTQKNRMINAV